MKTFCGYKCNMSEKKGINTDDYLARFHITLPLIKFASFALIVHYCDEKCFENYAALTRSHAAYFVFLLH